MAVLKHILRIKDTFANLVGGKMVDKQIAIASDLNGAPVTKNGTSFNIPAMSKKTTNGSTYTYLDTEFNDVDAKGLVKAESGMYKGSDLVTNIDWSTANQVNHNVGGVTALQINDDSMSIGVPIVSPIHQIGDGGVSIYEQCASGGSASKLNARGDSDSVAEQTYISSSDYSTENYHVEENIVSEVSEYGTHDQLTWSIPAPTDMAPVKSIRGSGLINIFSLGDCLAGAGVTSEILLEHKNIKSDNAIVGGAGRVLIRIAESFSYNGIKLISTMKKMFQVSINGLQFGDDTNNTTIESDGTLKFNGSATVYKDLYPTSVTTGTTGANVPSFSAYNGNLKAWEFLGATTVKEIQVGFQINHDYKEGSDIEPHIHLYAPSNGSGGIVKFFCEYTWANTNNIGAISPTTISGTKSLAASTIQNNVILSLGSITGTGKAISSILMCRIYRDPTDGADTFGSSVWLKSVDVHYECDMVGSRTSYAK